MLSSLQCLVIACGLVNTVLLLSGCDKARKVQTTTPAPSPDVPKFVAIDGVYSDPELHEPGTWKGVRAIATGIGEVPWENMFLIGSDDGNTWYTLTGGFDQAGKHFYIDASAKGGSKALRGDYDDGVITWANGKTWSRMFSQACKNMTGALKNNSHNGVYRDANCLNCDADSWEEVRFVSDVLGVTQGDEVYIIGSVDASDFWFVVAETDRATGVLHLDLAPVNGPTVDTVWDGGLIRGGGLVWQHLDRPCAWIPQTAQV